MAEPALPEAVVAVLVRDGHLLVIRRAEQVSNPGYWTLPSGRIERGESQPAALVREVREELGLAARPVAKVWECRTDDGGYRLHWWTARLAAGAPVPNPAEVAELRWVRPDGFARLAPTFAGDHEFVDRILPALDLPG